MVAQGYLVEQAVLSAVAAALLVCSVLQLVSERFTTHRMRVKSGGLRYSIHRIVPLMVSLMLLRCVDPRGVLGVYSDGVLAIIANNTTMVTLGAICVFLVLTLKPTFILIGLKPPPWLQPLLFSLWLGGVLLANGVGVAALLQGHTSLVADGLWMAYLAFFFLCTTFAANLVLSALREAVAQFVERHRQFTASSAAVYVAGPSHNPSSPSGFPQTAPGRYPQPYSSHGSTHTGHTATEGPAYSAHNTAYIPVPAPGTAPPNSYTNGYASREPSQSRTGYSGSSDRQALLGHMGQPPAGGLSMASINRLQSTVKRMAIVRVVGNVLVSFAVLVQVYVAVRCFAGQDNDNTQLPDPNEYRVRPAETLFWLVYAAAMLLTWHAWIPVQCSHKRATLLMS